MVRNPLAMQETQVRFLGWEDPLEKGLATHSSILFFFFLPLQYSCLENSMDRGAWRATVHEVARVGHYLATKSTAFAKLRLPQVPG